AGGIVLGSESQVEERLVESPAPLKALGQYQVMATVRAIALESARGPGEGTSPRRARSGEGSETRTERIARVTEQCRAELGEEALSLGRGVEAGRSVAGGEPLTIEEGAVSRAEEGHPPHQDAEREAHGSGDGRARGVSTR